MGNPQTNSDFERDYESVNNSISSEPWELRKSAYSGQKRSLYKRKTWLAPSFHNFAATKIKHCSCTVLKSS